MIRLRSAALEAWILPRGAALAGLWLKSVPRSLVLGFADPLDFERHPIYAGAIVGPVANRIAGARVTIGGTPWQMPANEGLNCLHSGPPGLHALTWEVIEQTGAAVCLRAELAHGAGGLPGHRRIEARYSLSDDGTLDLRLSADSDRATVMNLAHHPYWTLDDRPTVAEHSLLIAADRWLPTGGDLIPTGEIAPVAVGGNDFRTARLVPADRTLDSNFCLAMARRDAPEHAATLTGSGGVALRIETTEPGLQVYNGRHLPKLAVQMHPGQALAPLSGIALEPQGWPDAPHRPAFPQIALEPGQTYLQHSRYVLST